MSAEEPTARIRRPDPAAEAPTTALPGPLNLAGEPPIDADGHTDVLSLDEMFEGAPATADSAQRTDRGGADEAPTWTAMPVVPVRSEPATAHGWGSRAEIAAAPLGGQVRTDAAAAWQAAVRRTRLWLERDDNGLTLATALVAVILIIAITGLS
jgi:hypothetical protein